MDSCQTDGSTGLLSRNAVSGGAFEVSAARRHVGFATHEGVSMPRARGVGSVGSRNTQA